MAITDLTGTTWVFNSILSMPSNSTGLPSGVNIGFDSNDISCVLLAPINWYDPNDLDFEHPIPKMKYGYLDNNSFQQLQVYEDGVWTSEAYRTITFTGDGDVSNAALIAWLEANATQIIPAATVTYGNTSVGTLTQLGQKMRIPSTTLTQDGFVYYLDDIKIECNPASGNQVRCSYWDPYQSDYTDIFATEDAVTQVLDVADQLALGPIMITYEEVPATTFTIDGTTYDVDANTAYWYNWVESAYAPSGSGIEMDPTSSTYFVHLGGTASNYGIFYNGSLQSPGD